MKIGIISDTHDAYKNVLKAVNVFNEKKVKYILHAGDMVSPSTAEAFAGVGDAKFIAVFGNCDLDKLFLATAINDFGGQIHQAPYTGHAGGKRIFMTHRPVAMESIIESGRFDLVIYGHTHKQDIRKVGETLVINPGKSAGRLMGKSSVVVLELDDMSAEVILLK
ncbi:MAG TPA: metallophosphoesterase [Phycisphaerales bacterium]|nr:metallophosphoesterase [Phycisphaerales bacterium]